MLRLILHRCTYKKNIHRLCSYKMVRRAHFFDTVKISDFNVNDSTILKSGSTYKVKYGNEEFDALLLMIGNLNLFALLVTLIDSSTFYSLFKNSKEIKKIVI